MKHVDLVVFDIETITDADDHGGAGFPKPPHHVPVAIAHLHAEIRADGAQEPYGLVELRCGGKSDYGERELLKGFVDHVGAKHPRLVTFNGRAFDLPVVKHRTMACGLSAPLLTSRDHAYGAT